MHFKAVVFMLIISSTAIYGQGVSANKQLETAFVTHLLWDESGRKEAHFFETTEKLYLDVLKVYEENEAAVCNLALLYKDYADVAALRCITDEKILKKKELIVLKAESGEYSDKALEYSKRCKYITNDKKE